MYLLLHGSNISGANKQSLGDTLCRQVTDDCKMATQPHTHNHSMTIAAELWMRAGDGFIFILAVMVL